MRYEITTAPTVEPITLTEAKLFCRVDHSTEDDLITQQIVSAREFFERETGVSLITRTVTANLRFWPMSTVILLPIPPLLTISSITYQLTGGSSTLATSVYAADTGQRHAATLKPGQSWPTTELFPPGITIVYTAGFGAAASAIPDDIIQGLYSLIASWYENREAIYVPGDRRGTQPYKMPFGLDDLIARYRKKYADR